MLIHPGTKTNTISHTSANVMSFTHLTQRSCVCICIYLYVYVKLVFIRALANSIDRHFDSFQNTFTESHRQIFIRFIWLYFIRNQLSNFSIAAFGKIWKFLQMNLLTLFIFFLSKSTVSTLMLIFQTDRRSQAKLWRSV